MFKEIADIKVHGAYQQTHAQLAAFFAPEDLPDEAQ